VLIIVPAAGAGERWDNHGGITKHEAVVAGERIIDRLVRQLRPHATAMYLVGGPQAAGVQRRKPKLDPAKGDIDKIASSRHLWANDRRTLIVFGDVVLTDAAAARIASHQHDGWYVYGRHGASRYTGKQYGELYALSVMPEAHGELDDLLARTAALAPQPNRLWHLYRMGIGQPTFRVMPPGGRFVAIDDASDDVDTPEEWEVMRRLHGQTAGVVIPWREEPTRRPALDHVLAWYAKHHPELPVHLAQHDGAEFSKPHAVNLAARQLQWDVLVVADADLFVPPDNLREAIRLAYSCPWVVPQDVVLRLTEQATKAVYADPALDPWEGEAERRYAAVAGGGLFVIRRDNYLRVGGFDERFGMWGAEDQAFQCAADCLLGRREQLPGTLVHLWHEPMARRETPRWKANVRLLKRYREAMNSPAAMAQLLALDGDWNEGNGMRFVNTKTGARVDVPRHSKAAAHLANRPHWVAVGERVDLPAPKPPVARTAPPRAGAGSSRSAWAKYAVSLGLDVDGLARDMIIEMCDAHTD